MPKPHEFDGKSALVTGAGSGLGRTISIEFASYGAIVAANDITPINLDRTLEIIRERGGRVRDYVTDISKKMPVQNLVDEVLTDFGRIDFLVNNASVSPSAPLLELEEWDWRRTIDVNLSGPFFLIQLVSRVMRDQGSGAIINITGAYSDHQEKNRPAFLASKQGLIGLTYVAADELGKYGIRVNAVSPNQLTRSIVDLGEADFNDALGSVGVRHTIEDNTAKLVLFLCSQEAEHINGAVFDGRDRIPDG
jgi:NAD(P)-dependent dehydrogenase (short-subunit alcohol dehydrogenase family)